MNQVYQSSVLAHGSVETSDVLLVIIY